ncbi:hypothetical protein PR048_006188 [Dryococelus australis]|uniref:Uncharacterized protein n=1 Tax=Dryococelus australis TaxID=614101 RepID=A0ABQ9ICG1_9NEOP|nr:hypothetical protein PR048_006188 [Dryococelus australis]
MGTIGCHVIRKSDDAMSREVMEGTQSKMHFLGRPRLRWWDKLEKDLKQLHVDEGWSKALDRSRWRQLFKATCGLQGL